MGADGWAELLQHPRVLLLAEAGSGKTAEMGAQVARLLEEGKYAFFIPVEALREPLSELLSPDQERSFAAWKVEGQASAWFFLDAVDELKLTKEKLERALGRLAKAVDGLFHRTNVVLSCRPNDWRPSSDLATFQEKLPIAPDPAVASLPSDEAFLAPLREHGGGRKSNEKRVAPGGHPRVVVLLPLSDRQIETFAGSHGVQDVPALIAEIRRQDAWIFARRPLDLLELINSWRVNGRFGSRAEQHEANVATKLRDNPDRADQNLLSDDRARSGAEKLALALALTRTRTIRSPGQALDAERAEGVLDAAEILVDWTEAERQALLRRALFDPATYGRVRFHHRSVQEYLAARRLRTLRKACISARKLRRLLFAVLYGVPLVIPSMQAIAAWLALWDDDVRRELMAREPETLLSMGDPGSLPIDVRAQLLRAFADTYGGGGWRGLDIPISEVRRLADAELASVVRELWDARPTSPEVRELLLETIGQGPIEVCADIAHSIAFDDVQPDILRLMAVKALIACGKLEIIRNISDSILREPAKWPNGVIYAVVYDFFPTVLSAIDVVGLLHTEPRNNAGGISWAVRQIVDAVEPSSEPAIELRGALADAIWRSRYEKQEWYRLAGHLNHVVPALARLCERQLEVNTLARVPDVPMIWACIVANRFSDASVGENVAIGNKLKKYFEANPGMREAAFWDELWLISEVAHSEVAKELYFRALHGSVVDPLTDADRPWLLKAVRESHSHEHKTVALHALLSLWVRGSREQSELDELLELAMAIGDADLADVIRRASAPPEPDSENLQLGRTLRQQSIEHEERERQRLDKWLHWRERLVAAPEAGFTGEQLQITIHNIYFWLAAKQSDDTRHNVWAGDALREFFGDDVATRASKAFQSQWRMHKPILWSKRTEADRNSNPVVWAEGLTGLAAEATNPSWAHLLTPDEARVAAAYATIEINKFPSWLPSLVVAHPKAVDEVIGGELTAEIAMADEHWHLPALENLSQTEVMVKRLLAHRLQARLPKWPAVFRNEECYRQSEHYLGLVLRTLGDVFDGREKASLAQICASQFSANPNGPLALIWLRWLFQFSPETATQLLEDDLASLPEGEREGRAVAIFASLFSGGTIVFADDKRRAASLGRLVRCAYRYVRPADDPQHEGIYSPDIRDSARTAREFLLGSLLDTPGAEAQKVMHDLAADSQFAHFPDRLRFLARRRAASDAEAAALKAEEVVGLEKGLDAPPQDRDGLFTIMIDRIEDLAHDLMHDDFTDRRTLRTIKEETEMQRTLARRLRDAAKGAYTVSREEEVADLKKTDIRLVATRGDQKAVIEVKIADKWSLRELEHALRAQLVAQYLRHQTCKAGCLLLTYHGTKKCWKHPDKRSSLSFIEATEYLQGIAQVIEKELDYEVRLTVYGLDLTDPALALARP